MSTEWNGDSLEYLRMSDSSWRLNEMVTHLNIFEWVTHHGDEHVDEDDDDGDVIESEQEHSDSFDDRCCVISAREAVRVQTPLFFVRVLDFHAVYVDEAEHRPK